jgi:hypothetical protein
MNTWDKQRTNEIYKIKLQKVKSTMKKRNLYLNLFSNHERHHSS